MSAPVDGSGRRRRGPQGGLEQRRAQRARAAAPGQAGAGDGERDPQAGGRVLRPGERAPKMRFRLVRELACDLDRPVAVACRVLEVSASGYYEWLSRPASARDVADARLLDTMIAIHTGSRGTYGARRVHAELRLGRAVDVGRRQVERLMRLHGLARIHRRRFRPGRPAPAVHQDLVTRQFHATGPDRLSVPDITQHRTGEGWVYAAVVLDVFSHRVVGWSIAEHLRTG